ncbi:MAG: hypothetical protein WD602_08960 [Actinomycetota bacterium]
MKALLAAVYLMVGAFVAYNHAYMSFYDWGNIASAVAAVVAWPLVLAGFNLHLGAM